MKKTAGMEKSEINDPRTGKPILISTTVRLFYRKVIDSQNYAGLRNQRLNSIIAKQFAESSNNVLHYFWISKDKRIIGEIRSLRAGAYFISAITDTSVNLIVVQGDYFKPPNYRRSVKPDEILEMGDS